MGSVAPVQQDPNPVYIPVSREELKTGKLTQRNLEKAIHALHHDGLVILDEVIPDHDHIDTLNKKMLEDAEQILQMGVEGHFNFIQTNLQQNPPPQPEYFFKDIFLNPIVQHVTSTHLGNPPRWAFSSSNVALPVVEGSPEAQAQPTHSDAYFKHPTHPFSLVVSVPLITMSPKNGGTEFWLGTHEGFDSTLQEAGTAIDSSEGGLGEARKEKRREARPPTQPEIKKGSVVIRDIRLWHGGRPNFSKEPRVLLSMVQFSPWYRNKMQIPFAESLRETVESYKGYEIPAVYLSDKEASEKYLIRAFGGEYDFHQEI